MTVGVTHHLALGGHEYLIKPFSYSKRAAPQFGARFATGDPDFNNLSFWQHWSQKCFVGGMDSEEFADDAMYDEGAGVNTWEHDKVTLARDMRRGTGSNWALSAGVVAKHVFHVYNQKLWVLEVPSAAASRLWGWDAATDAWVEKTAVATTGIRAQCIGTFNGELYIGGRNSAGTSAQLIYSTGALTSWTTATVPTGMSTTTIHSLRSFQQKLYVAYNSHIWRFKTDHTVDGNTQFYIAYQNSESNHIIAMETHLGFLYMLSKNGHIHRSDGNATFDIWSWDGQTDGAAIRSFDGRLFIATNEYSDPEVPAAAYGVLYQLTGSAVTELKRWGRAGEFTGLGSLTVYNGKMFYGASNLLGFRAGFGAAMYDPLEDAHSIFSANEDTTTYARGSAPYTNYAVTNVIAFANRIYIATRGSGVFYTRFAYRDRIRLIADYDTSAAGAQPGPQNGGWFTTSTYDAGMSGVRKLWRKISIEYELPHSSTSILVEYSGDGGASWTALTAVTTGSTVTRTKADFYLNNFIRTTLKLRFTLRSTNSIYTPIFYGFVVSYVPTIEPNWMWTFTIVLSKKQKQLDGVSDTVDTEAELAFLANLWRTKQLTTFVDIDGTAWATGGTDPGVLIYDIDFRVPHQVQPLEGEVVVTLLEAVETY